jgi:hypothetical protein
MREPALPRLPSRNAIKTVPLGNGFLSNLRAVRRSKRTTLRKPLCMPLAFCMRFVCSCSCMLYAFCILLHFRCALNAFCMHFINMFRVLYALMVLYSCMQRSVLYACSVYLCAFCVLYACMSALRLVCMFRVSFGPGRHRARAGRGVPRGRRPGNVQQWCRLFPDRCRLFPDGC